MALTTLRMPMLGTSALVSFLLLFPVLVPGAKFGNRRIALGRQWFAAAGAKSLGAH